MTAHLQTEHASLQEHFTSSLHAMETQVPMSHVSFSRQNLVVAEHQVEPVYFLLLGIQHVVNVEANNFFVGGNLSMAFSI